MRHLIRAIPVPHTTGYTLLGRFLNTHDGAVDVLADHTLLLNRAGYLDIHVSDLIDPLTNTSQRISCLLRTTDTHLRLRPALVHHTDCQLGRVLQSRDHLLDISGRLLCTSGQAAHLIGNNRKPPALIARPGSLYCRIQCQQIGLLGDSANYIQYLGNLIAVRLQLLNNLSGPLNLTLKLTNCFTGLRNHGLPAVCFSIRFLGSRRGVLRITRDLLNTDNHLIHRRRNLPGFTLLSIVQLITCTYFPQQMIRETLQLPRSITNTTNYRPGLRLPHAQRKFNPPELIMTTGIKLRTKRVVSNPDRHSGQLL